LSRHPLKAQRLDVPLCRHIRAAPGGHLMPSLIVVAGPNEGDYYPLGKRTIVIGRQEGCPVQIVDDRVSRRHVQIRCEEGAGEEGRYHLLDMKSQNGTFVNGRRIEAEVVLED